MNDAAVAGIAEAALTADFKKLKDAVDAVRLALGRQDGTTVGVRAYKSLPHASSTRNGRNTASPCNPALQGSGGRALLQLRNEARQRGVKGRSTMNKAQLEAALNR